MCFRICTGFKGVSFREAHLWEHIGRTDQIALITCLKKLDVSSASLIKLRTLKVPTPSAPRLKGPESPLLKLKGPFMKLNGHFLQAIPSVPKLLRNEFVFRFLRCKNYVTAQEINSPRGPHSPEITVRKSSKSPVRITAPENDSKTISVM